MRKLTEEEVKGLQACKGVEGGKEKFFDIIEEIYKDEPAVMAEIKDCRAKMESLDYIDSFPAWAKTQEMYFSYMDDLIAEIGYHK